MAPLPVAQPKVDEVLIEKLTTELVQKHGEQEQIARGVRQVAALWRSSDGDLSTFVHEHYLPDEARRRATLLRLQEVFEQLDGHGQEISRSLRWATDVDIGPLLTVDPLLAAYQPAAHQQEDLFRSGIGFVVLLNFPLTTLAEKTKVAATWSRETWARARLADRFAVRIPATVAQESSKAYAAAGLYISQYNIWMHHLLNEKRRRLFPRGMRLISHWNLRDELKASYGTKGGLHRQRMIVRVMERIVTQTIPRVVIDNPHVDWNPFSNVVTLAPTDTVPEDAPEREAKVDTTPEDNERYAHLLRHFHAGQKADPSSPAAPTRIARAFLDRELAEERVDALLEEILTSPLVPRVAKRIQERLGRPLEPHDLWYNGFAFEGLDQDRLDQLTRKRYPTAEAFAADIPRILQQIGFDKARAKMLAEHIRVDGSRGAGHAMGAERRGDFPRLRTRIGKGGMDYKGYNIAIHELGHNVEQVISLYEVDHTLLSGVPNNAITEAVAFVFQARDRELLGVAARDEEAERMRVLNDFWATWEIAGVAKVDTAVWHWMYDHPAASPQDLRDATVRIAKSVWDQYYAPVLGKRDTPLLAVYSHIISYPLYLPNYVLGHLIAFQVEAHLAKPGTDLGAELVRIAKHGKVLPDLWMKNATGSPIGTAALFEATVRALGSKK